MSTDMHICDQCRLAVVTIVLQHTHHPLNCCLVQHHDDIVAVMADRPYTCLSVSCQMLYFQIVEETIPELVKLKKEGLIRHIGITGLPLPIYKKVLDRCPPFLVHLCVNCLQCFKPPPPLPPLDNVIPSSTVTSSGS